MNMSKTVKKILPSMLGLASAFSKYFYATTLTISVLTFHTGPTFNLTVTGSDTPLKSQATQEALEDKAKRELILV